MNNLIQTYEKQQIKKLVTKNSIPTFRSGDTIKVTLKIIEGERSRLQSFEGICIAKKNNSINSKFTIRKISHGEGVERVFPLFSPNIEKIEVIRKGNVKRAKLYFLRERKGKSARISDRDRGDEADQYSISEEEKINSDDSKETSLSLENKDMPKEKNIDEENNKKIVSEKTNEAADDESKSIDTKSESPASEADKTKDESES